jgi:hypothetical protein
LTSAPPLEPLDRDLWIATRPLPLIVGDVGTRMSVVRLGQELLLHSPVALDAATREALDAQGRVRWVVGPSKVHHLYLGDYASAYPDAELCATPGLPEKRRDLHFDCVLDDSRRDKWGDALRFELFGGAPGINELVFFHPASRSLLLSDLAFNVTREGRNRARLFHWLVGATGRFGPHRIVRAAIRDRTAARRSLERILSWDFERVIVTHGEVLERDGHARMQQAFAYL